MYSLTLPGRLDISRMGRRWKNSASLVGDGVPAALGDLISSFELGIWVFSSVLSEICFCLITDVEFKTFFSLCNHDSAMISSRLFFFLLTDNVCCASAFIYYFRREDFHTAGSQNISVIKTV